MAANPQFIGRRTSGIKKSEDIGEKAGSSGQLVRNK